MDYAISERPLPWPAVLALRGAEANVLLLVGPRADAGVSVAEADVVASGQRMNEVKLRSKRVCGVAMLPGCRARIVMVIGHFAAHLLVSKAIHRYLPTDVLPHTQQGSGS